METERRYRVLADYDVHDPQPLQLEAGQEVRIVRSDLGWPGWVWIEGGNNAGWIPESHLEGISPGRARTTSAFDGSDLSARRGDVLIVEEEAPGWIRGRRGDGVSGWFPLFNLKPHRHT
jgi:hypothetical protein